MTDWIRVLAVGLVCSGSVGAQSVRNADLLEEQAKARIHVVGMRIQPDFLATPGECLEFDDADLKVVLRGEPIAPGQFRLDRERTPTLHALLVDTSGSIGNSLDHVRSAASEYVQQLPPEDRAMIITFDDSVILHQPLTEDRDALLRAVDIIRPGTATAMYDGLHAALQEAASHRERPVVILLTDGMDSSSFHLREDVWEVVRTRPDLTVFSIGFDLPELDSRNSSTRRFLQRLAAHTNGKYFVAPTGGRLASAYRRIREMLDNEAVLYVTEPEPDTEPGKLKVKSRRPGCQVQVFKKHEVADDPLGVPIPGPYPEIPHTFPLPPDPRYLKSEINTAYHQADPECAPTADVPDGIVEMALEDLWTAEIGPRSIRGCILDVTMDRGVLYDPYSMSVPQNWWSSNSSLKVKSRRFDIPLLAIGDLPGDPAELMEGFADFALSVEDDVIERDGRKRPYSEHARPYHDWPGMVHGRTFFDMRGRIAGAIFLREDYREWALGKLRQEARQDLERLERKFRRLAPGSPDTAVQLAALESEQGRAIQARAEAPSSRDLTRFLSAWLGDIPAHELFVRWEATIVQEMLAGRPARDAETLSEQWRALRQMLFASSYTRMLTPLFPVHDRERDRIGFYRIVLPRTAWYLKRLKGYKNHPGWSNLPLDLVPDIPLARWAVADMLEKRPELSAQLRDHGYTVASLIYELLAKPGKQTPERAFRETRIVLQLEASSASPDGVDGARITIEADLDVDGRDMNQPRITSLRMTAEEDPVLAALALEIEHAYDNLDSELPGRPADAADLDASPR